MYKNNSSIVLNIKYLRLSSAGQRPWLNWVPAIHIRASDLPPSSPKLTPLKKSSTKNHLVRMMRAVRFCRNPSYLTLKARRRMVNQRIVSTGMLRILLILIIICIRCSLEISIIWIPFIIWRLTRNTFLTLFMI